MKPSNTKAIAYYRSAGHQITEQQMANFDQREIVELYANDNGIEIVEEFASCSKRHAKEKLEQALGYCKSNPAVKFLLVKSFDRISRDIQDYHVWKLAFEKCGVQLISVIEPTDSTPMGKFTEAMYLTMTHLDSQRRSEAVKKGLRRKKELQS